MKKSPLVFLSSQGLESEIPSFWVHTSDYGTQLPHPSDLVAQFPSELLEQSRVAFALEERFLNPIRVGVDKKMSKRDVQSYLLWKLKKSLPYGVDQVILRYRTLSQPNAFLALTLPQDWVSSLFKAFQEKGVKCGFIGGLFHLFTSHPRFRGQAVLCMFRNAYVFCDLDKNGGFKDYRHRRLPFDDADELDVIAMSQSDLSSHLHTLNDDQTLTVLNLAHELDGSIPHLVHHLKRAYSHVEAPQLMGTVLDRFRKITHE